MAWYVGVAADPPPAMKISSGAVGRTVADGTPPLIVAVRLTHRFQLASELLCQHHCSPPRFNTK